MIFDTSYNDSMHRKSWYLIYVFILFQIRAFGAEGMIEEMLRYLNIAENVLWNMDPDQKSDLYGTVLHALVKAKEVRIYFLLPLIVLLYEMLNWV